jgi:predicted DNA-binding protein
MEVRLRPETESRIHELAEKTGRAADELVEEAMAGYLHELAETREMLDRRYDELKSGNVKAVDGEAAFSELRRKSEERRRP